MRGRPPANDTLNCQDQQLTEIPEVQKPGLVVTLNASNNLIKNLPEMRQFAMLRYLDLSNNKIIDASPLFYLHTLRELDVSGNRITSLDFAEGLENLEVLRASRNRIREILVPLPDNLIDLEISSNEFTNLDFMEKNVPVGIEKIDVSGNSIDSLISLRYLAIFQQLHTFTVGLLDVFKGLKVLQYVKHLCPSIEYFDDVHCADVEEPDFDTERLIDVLVSLNEADLEDLLSRGNIGEIAWEEPSFVQYEEDTFPTTPIRVLQDRIQAIEDEIAKQADDGVNRKNGLENLLSPFQKKDLRQDIADLKQLIQEMTQQMVKVAELLYVHDRALEHLWK